MLSIYLGDCENEIYNPPLYFINQYEDFWLESELAKKMIKDVDKSEVVGPHLIQSPVLGPISPRELSGGVKTLLILAYEKAEKYLMQQHAVITALNGFWRLPKIRI